MIVVHRRLASGPVVEILVQSELARSLHHDWLLRVVVPARNHMIGMPIHAELVLKRRHQRAAVGTAKLIVLVVVVCPSIFDVTVSAVLVFIWPAKIALRVQVAACAAHAVAVRPISTVAATAAAQA